MMKRLLICALSLLIAGTGAAQTGGGLKVGVKGGVNVSNMIASDEDENFDSDYKTGFHVGLFTNIPVAGALSFAPELLFSQKGYKTTGSSILGGPYEFSVTTNFVEVPILLNLRATDSFNIHLGPQLSFLTSTTESFEQGENEYRNTIEEENENLRKSLLGGVLGVGFRVGPKVGFHGRYAIDFQKNENGTTTTPRYRNRVFQLGLGITL